MQRRSLAVLGFGLSLGLFACDEGDPAVQRLLAARTSLAVERLYPRGANRFDECINASPLAIESRGKPFVLLAVGDAIVALDPERGTVAWRVPIESATVERAYIVATPVVVQQKLVVAFQRTPDSDHSRLSHHVAVVDLEARALDPAFVELEISATRPNADGDADIEFSPKNSLSRSALVHADVPDRELGLVYVSYGNQGDVRPWHGWVFELDLDRWRDGGDAAAVSSLLLTSPETNCGAPGTSGSGQALCGAGVWSPAGPKVYPSEGGGFELVIPTGNGVLDIARGDYSHALLRATRGLAFDPHCDMDACRDFDPLVPARACLESCKDLFVPRLLPGDADLGPESGLCENMSLLECYARLDWDLGANSPARVELEHSAVFVLPGKDGTVFLLDADQMGLQYDRKRIVKPCGARGDKCLHDWAGMMVTEPVVTSIDGAKAVLVPSFVFDATHPAGVTALRIDETAGGPRLSIAWQAPAANDPLATLLFREHPSRIALQELGKESYAWVASPRRAGHGSLLAIRVRDGAIVAGLDLVGRGQRFVKPLVSGRNVYVPSCEGLHGPSELEAFTNN